jgi:hypothetical protein
MIKPGSLVFFLSLLFGAFASGLALKELSLEGEAEFEVVACQMRVRSLGVSEELAGQSCKFVGGELIVLKPFREAFEPRVYFEV